MLRRAFCWMLGGLGVGSAFDPGVIICHDEKLPAVDMGVFSICDANRGGKVSIYVMDGGTLNVPEGATWESVTICEGGSVGSISPDCMYCHDSGAILDYIDESRENLMFWKRCPVCKLRKKAVAHG